MNRIIAITKTALGFLLLMLAMCNAIVALVLQTLPSGFNTIKKHSQDLANKLLGYEDKEIGRRDTAVMMMEEARGRQIEFITEIITCLSSCTVHGKPIDMVEGSSYIAISETDKEKILILLNIVNKALQVESEFTNTGHTQIEFLSSLATYISNYKLYNSSVFNSGEPIHLTMSITLKDNIISSLNALIKDLQASVKHGRQLSKISPNN